MAVDFLKDLGQGGGGFPGPGFLREAGIEDGSGELGVRELGVSVHFLSNKA